MSPNTFLMGFILVDVYIVGVLSVIAYRHFSEHIRPTKQLEPRVHTDDPERPMPKFDRDHVAQTSETQFKAVLKQAVAALEYDLDSTTGQINGLLKNFAGDIINDEMQSYRTDLNRLRKQAEVDMGGIKQAVASHQAEIEQNLAAEMEIEKKRLISQIDTKLADAVGSFLLETLQHNVDLGSQDEFLVAMLEEHKADFKKEVSSES